MFEISQLKAKKLPELQDIAKNLNVPKYRSLKKLDLVYQILDFQASNPEVIKAKQLVTEEPKSSEPSIEPKETSQKPADTPKKESSRPVTNGQEKSEEKEHPRSRSTSPPPKRDQNKESFKGKQHRKKEHPGKTGGHEKKSSNYDKDLKNTSLTAS
jgi:transcription termination factor Rho